MVFPPEGTFDYVAIVPEGPLIDGFECTARSRDIRPPVGDPIIDNRLTGYSPLVQVSPIPADNAQPGRARITFAATNPAEATIARFSLDVDPFLATRLEPGDEMSFTRTGSGYIGFSVLRAAELVVAAGSVTSVPLGRGIRAVGAYDLQQRVTAVVRELDPAFKFPEKFLKVSVDDESAILMRGDPSTILMGVRHIGPIEAFVFHDHCAAIWRQPQCSLLAAITTAKWLYRRSFSPTVSPD